MTLPVITYGLPAVVHVVFVPMLPETSVSARSEAAAQTKIAVVTTIRAARLTATPLWSSQSGES